MNSDLAKRTGDRTSARTQPTALDTTDLTARAAVVAMERNRPTAFESTNGCSE